MKILLLFACLLVSGSAAEKLTPPSGRPLRVAVVVTMHATLIDFAGPWEVFQDVQLPHREAFQLYTVSDDTQPVTISADMKVVPNYSYANAPEPDIVVVGAQMGSPATQDWLRRQAARVELMMSVCTGASKLAALGLLDGQTAATHHEFVEKFNRKYPQVKFVAGERFVESGPRLLTAGGLTSGIDAALHVVDLYFGRDVAERTAAYMEYESTRWKRN